MKKKVATVKITSRELNELIRIVKLRYEQSGADQEIAKIALKALKNKDFEKFKIFDDEITKSLSVIQTNNQSEEQQPQKTEAEPTTETKNAINNTNDHTLREPLTFGHQSAHENREIEAERQSEAQAKESPKPPRGRPKKEGAEGKPKVNSKSRRDRPRKTR